jgi:hypothetical protein
MNSKERKRERKRERERESERNRENKRETRRERERGKVLLGSARRRTERWSGGGSSNWLRSRSVPAV